MASQYDRAFAGASGFKAITSGALGAGSWTALKVLGGDLTLTVTSAVGDGLTGVVVQQGDVLVGRFTNATITAGTGTLLGYYAQNPSS